MEDYRKSISMWRNRNLVKDEMIKMIHNMPNDVSLDDIMAELYFRQKVDAGLYALDENKGLAHQKVKEKLKKWLE